MTNDQSATSLSRRTTQCADCGAEDASDRVELFDRVVMELCDKCCDRRAVRCPFCGSSFGREVKRESRCKSCGESVARNSKTPYLATRLASSAICESLSGFTLVEASPIEGDWIRSTLPACLLQAACAGRDSTSIESAFAAALRTKFEFGLTRDRLNTFGFAFARAIWVCGGNPRAIQRTIHRQRLETLRERGLVVAVRILPVGDGCENCQSLVGREWTIESALDENPLPCRGCLNTNENGYGWCRCEYEPRLVGEYESQLDGEYQSILDEAMAELDAENARLSRQAILDNAETYARAEAQLKRIMGQSESREPKPRRANAAENSGSPSGLRVLSNLGDSRSIAEVAKIASDGWHRVRNRGNRGVHDGFNGAIAALSEVGIQAGQVPNREQPQFFDIVLTTTVGGTVILRFCTSEWEYVPR